MPFWLKAMYRSSLNPDVPRSRGGHPLAISNRKPHQKDLTKSISDWLCCGTAAPDQVIVELDAHRSSDASPPAVLFDSSKPAPALVAALKPMYNLQLATCNLL